MEWIVKILKDAPELAIFLTLGLGVALGRINVKGFSLGTVTGVLLMGVVVGQLNIEIEGIVKSTFFLLFLFAVGYSVGPQFIHSLKKEGIPQILFSCCVCVACLLTVYVIAIVAGFDLGHTIGLFSGANTISAAIGVATDTIDQLPISSDQKDTIVNSIPVAYAVTYIFGTAGTAWFLSSMGPKILGGDVKKQTKEYEAKLGGAIQDNDPSLISAYNGVVFRVFEATSDFFKTNRTVKEIEELLLSKGTPVYVEGIRKSDGTIIKEPQLTDMVSFGEKLVLNGSLEAILDDKSLIGHEVLDIELLEFRVEELKVIAANKELIGQTLRNLKENELRHGVIIRKIVRANITMPLLNDFKIERGDVIEIEGRKKDVDRFAKHLGYAERPTDMTDLLFLGFGIFIGGLLGSLALHFGNVPVSLSSSGGVLIMGIIFGWLRSRKPTFGAIPQPAIWLMNNLGLNVFIAVVGISAGPHFIAGLKDSGVSLFIAGIFASVIPMVIGLLLGKYVFKFHPAITLGACAGARTTTASLGEIEDALDSKVPALAYTTTYAVGNTLLIIWGVVIVFLMS